MATISEDGYGAKLQNAKNILTFIENLSKYKSSRPEDSIAEYEKLIQVCDTANTTVATDIQGYTMAVDKRTKAFSGAEKTSLTKLLSPIGKAIAGQYDKSSKEYNSAMSIINKMRSQKVEKAPANPTDTQKERISKSELSYGSKLQNFKDLIASLSVFQNYAPVNPDITLDKLKAMITELEALNKDVGSKIAPLNISRKSRTELFADLSKRTQRIKANVSSIYGVDSVEYKQISGLKV